MSSLENHLCHLVLKMRTELKEAREKLGIVDSVEEAREAEEARVAEREVEEAREAEEARRRQRCLERELRRLA